MEGLPAPGAATDILVGRTVEGRAQLGMAYIWNFPQNFSGVRVSTVEAIINTEADAAGWTATAVPDRDGRFGQGGIRWDDPTGKYQIRISFFHDEPQLYGTWANVPRGPNLRGKATLSWG